MNALSDEEIFIRGVLTIGSLLTIVFNKRVNCHTLLEIVMEHPVYMDLLSKLTHSDSEQEAIRGIIQMFPSLIKSRNTTLLLRKLHGSQRTRKKNL